MYIKNTINCNKAENISYEHEGYFEIITVELLVAVTVHPKLIRIRIRQVYFQNHNCI